MHETFHDTFLVWNALSGLSDFEAIHVKIKAEVTLERPINSILHEMQKQFQAILHSGTQAEGCKR